MGLFGFGKKEKENTTSFYNENITHVEYSFNQKDYNNNSIATNEERIQPKKSGKRSFDAAKIDNLTASWNTNLVSMDHDLRGGLRKLRGRSRELTKNDPYFKRFLGLVKENVIGSNGITLQPNVTNFNQKNKPIRDDAASAAIMRAWKKWGKIKNCTVTKKISWLELQHIVIGNVARDGEVLIRKVRGWKKNDYRFALQILSADHLDEEYNKKLPNGNYIRMGIEFDEWGAPVAYHIFRYNPADDIFSAHRARNERLRIPADDIIHLFLPEDANQSRGCPWGVSAMTRSNMLNGYEYAELVGARVGASHMGFFISPDGEGYSGDDFEVDGHTDEKVRISKATPGMFEQLPEGVEFKEFSPNHPTTAYESFVKGVLRGIASGLGVSYNKLANDYVGVNFSSLRQAELSERETWKLLQTWIIEHLHDNIFEDWLFLALAANQVHVSTTPEGIKKTLPLNKFEVFNNVIWCPRGWQWVDPLKEVQAHGKAMALKLKSATSIINEGGGDIEQVYQEIQKEQQLRQKYEIPEPDINIVSGDLTNATISED